MSRRSHERMQSAGLLEAVSAAALRSRLKRYDCVETSIQCNFLELLGGAVSHVDIHGKGWESKAGLTARLLEASAGTLFRLLSAPVTTSSARPCISCCIVALRAIMRQDQPVAVLLQSCALKAGYVFAQ